MNETMNKTRDANGPAPSVLSLTNLHVNNIIFRRKPAISEFKLIYNFTQEIGEREDGTCEIVLSTHVRNEEESFDLNVAVSGEFVIEGPADENTRDILFSKNAIAILFPYLRSQVSIVTAQPGFMPVVMPVMNINQLFEESEEK